MYRRHCRHITEAQEQVKSSRPVTWDRRWFWGIRDERSVFWQMLLGIGGPVTVFDGEMAELVVWEKVSSVIQSVKIAGELVEADSDCVERAYYHYLTHR